MFFGKKKLGNFFFGPKKGDITSGGLSTEEKKGLASVNPTQGTVTKIFFFFRKEMATRTCRQIHLSLCQSKKKKSIVFSVTGNHYTIHLLFISPLECYPISTPKKLDNERMKK